MIDGYTIFLQQSIDLQYNLNDSKSNETRLVLERIQYSKTNNMKLKAEEDEKR